jgi:hypothetical protein
VKVCSIDGVTYFNLTALEEKELTMIIQNTTPFKIFARSKLHKFETVQTVYPEDKIYYAQKYPNKSGSMLLIQFYNDEGNSINLEVDFMIITSEPRFYEIGDPAHLIEITVKFLGQNKVIGIRLIPKAEVTREKKVSQEITLIRFEFNIIDISIVQLTKGNGRRELVNLYFAGNRGSLEMRELGGVRLTAQIDHFQIDNNSNIKTSFPVILRVTEDKIRKNVPKKKFLELELAFEDPSKSSHLYFSNIIVALGNLETFIEEEFADQLLGYFENLSSRLSKGKQTTSHFDFIKRKYYEGISVDNSFDYNQQIWTFTVIDRVNNYVFIDNMVLPQLKVFVSYFQDPSSTVDKDFELISLIGVAVGGFENAEITLKGLHRE